MESASGRTFSVVDPSTEAEICRVSEGDAADINLAVRAALAAFALGSTWRTMDASRRGHLLFRLADSLANHAKEFVALEALDAGKPIDSARDDVDFAIKTLRYFAGYADKIHGQVRFRVNYWDYGSVFKWSVLN